MCPMGKSDHVMIEIKTDNDVSEEDVSELLNKKFQQVFTEQSEL